MTRPGMQLDILMRALHSFSKGARLIMEYEDEERQETRICRPACFRVKVYTQQGHSLFGAMGPNYDDTIVLLAKEILKAHPEHGAFFELANHLSVLGLYYRGGMVERQATDPGTNRIVPPLGSRNLSLGGGTIREARPNRRPRS